MKQNTLLRVLIVVCIIIISGILLTASRLSTGTGNSSSINPAENSNPKPANGEVMILQSLYEHLLTFN